MKLYSYWQSSSAWRVRIALALKEVAYETVAVDLSARQQDDPAYGDRNPLRQVPTLEWEHEGRVEHLTQSLAIIELLDELHPEPPLLPAEPRGRARTRELAEMVNAGIQPFQNLSLLQRLEQAHGVEPIGFAQYFIARGLRALEVRARGSAGRYLVGDGITLADLYLVPQLDVARRMAVDLAPYPTLRRCEAAASELPAFGRARPEEQPDAPSARGAPGPSA